MSKGEAPHRPAPKITIGTKRGTGGTTGVTPVDTTGEGRVDLASSNPRKLEVLNALLSELLGESMDGPVVEKPEPTRPRTVPSARERRARAANGPRPNLQEMAAAAKQMREEADAFEAELASAQRTVKALESLKADTGPALAVVAAAEEAAKPLTSEGFAEGLDLLRKSFPTAAAEARAKAEQAAEFARASAEVEDELNKAATRLSEILKAGDADAGPARDALENARQKFQGVSTAEQCLAAKSALGEFDKLAKGLEEQVKANAADRDAWTKARAEAAAALAACRDQPGAATCAAVRAPGDAVEQAIQAADLAAAPATPAAYRAAKAALAGVAAEAAKAAQVGAAAGAANSKLIQAQGALNALAPFQWIDPAAAKALLDGGRDDLNKAADEKAVVAAGTKLDQAAQAAQKLLSDNGTFTSAVRTTGAALDRAESLVRSLQGVYEFGPLINAASTLLTEIGQARAALASADTQGKVVDLARAANAFEARAEAAKATSAEGTTILLLLGNSRSKLEKMEALGYVDLTLPKKVLEAAELGVSRAADAAGAKAAVARLADFDKQLEKAKTAAKPAGEAREVYLAARRKAQEQLAAVLRMDGATAGSGVPADKRIDLIVRRYEAALKLAQSMAAAGTVDAYTRAARSFDALAGKVREAEAASAEVHLKAKADFKAQGDYDNAARAAALALAEIGELPGQEAARNEVAALIARARGLIKAEGPFVRGHAEALALLNDPVNGPAARLQKAKADEAARTKDATYDGEVRAAHTPVLAAVFKAGETDRLLTDIDYRGYRGELRAALELGTVVKDQDPTLTAKNRAEALKRIAAVKSGVEAAASKTRPLMITARNYLATLETAFIRPLESLAPEALVASARGELQRVRDVEVRSNAWSSALTRLDKLKAQLGGQLDAYRAASAEWNKAVAGIDQRLVAGEPWIKGWPERAGVLAQVLPALRMLKTSVTESREYDRGVAEANELFERYDTAVAAIKSAAEPGADLAALAQARASADARVNLLLASADAEFAEFAKAHLDGVRNLDAFPPFKQRSDALAAWKAFLAAPRPTGGKTIGEEFADRARTVMAGVTAARQALASLKVAGAGAIADAAKPARKADADEDDAKRPEALRAKIDLLASRGGDPAPFRSRLGPPNDLKAVEREVDAAIARIATDQANRARENRERVDKLRKVVRKEQGSEQTFKAFYEAVSEEADDIDALFQSGDPDLVSQAERATQALNAKFLAVKKPAEGAPTFDQVQDLWGKIAFALGGSFLDNVGSSIRGVPRKTYLMERMPVTYKRLSDKAVTLTAKSKALPPAEAVSLLTPLLAECDKAADDSVKAQTEYERFKEVSERVSGMLEQMVSDTATVLVFGKVDASAIEAKLKTQLADAKGLAKTEGQLPAALERLGALTAELETLRNAPEPRAALLKADAAAKREQAAVIDLCRQHEGLMVLFNQALAAAKAAVEKENGDATQITEIERLGSTAGKFVSPYMDLRSSLPHKRIAANPSPAMDKVNQAFTQARATLEQGISGARRVERFPAGTNVEVGGDFDAVENEWVRRANAFAAAVLALANDIESAARGDAVNGPAVAEVISPLIGRLRGLSGKFPAQAFTGPLATLREEKDSAKRKAARELALKEVRRMTAELTKDPLVQTLCKNANPFKTQVNAPASQLRAGLKSVEREVLVGV